MSNREPVSKGKRIVLATFGSLGDLHPFLALALALKGRGHEPVLATSELHRERVERHGITFRPVRPDVSNLEADPKFFARAMDARGGPSVVVREVLMPHVRDGFEDLRPVVDGADFLVSHTIVFPGPLVAESLSVPWASVLLAPGVLFSRFDPFVLPPLPWLRHLHPLGPRFWGPLFALAKRSTRSWTAEVGRFRAELGLEPGGHPLFEGAFSPDLVLAMFSSVLGSPQPDWPPQTRQTGFLFFDDPEGKGLDPELRAFLDAGEPPVVFTLGSSAVMTAGNFYEEGLAAVRAIGRRAVLLVGRDPRNQLREPVPDSVFVTDYAPYSALFPCAAVVVHQGGVGTTAQALRAGVPMLVVPFSHDQPDNAHRVERRGLGRMLSRGRFRSKTVSVELRRLLDEPAFATRCADVGGRVRAEDGAAAACEAIERVIAARVAASA